MVIATKSPVTAYAEAVLAGEVLTGRLVWLACQRHLDDLSASLKTGLEHGAERGLYFDAEEAQDALDFFGILKLAEGAHAGQPFILQPWQQFIVGSLFGWKEAGGYRRFRKAYIEIAKGNGKTPMAAAMGLYGLIADREPAAEIYTAGVTRDQANYLLADADKMVNATPSLKRIITQNAHNLSVRSTSSYMRAVSSEARNLDQKRVHMALIDEIHEHPTDLVVDKLTAGMKGRRQPLIIEITNSGYDRTSVCWQHHEYSIKVLEKSLQNDEWFAFVCGLDPCTSCYVEGKIQPVDGCDECDDWRDESVWPKANPNLDVSISRRYLRGQVETAKGMPANENITKRLNFCIWTEQVTRLIPMDAWDSQPERTELTQLEKQVCFAGLDLSSKLDFTALVMVFPDDEGGYDVVPHFWLPEKMVREYTQKGVPCEMWMQQGYIEQIPGEMIDQRTISQRIKEMGAKYRVAEIPYDPWNAAYIEAELGDVGAPLVTVSQNFQNMSAPTKELLGLLATRKFRHGGNPVLRWMASNVASLEDSNGNVRPHKGKSSGKVDGIVSAIMALGRAMLQNNGQSVYDQGDSLFL